MVFLMLYFNCRPLNYFVSYLLIEFHLAHIKHIIAIGWQVVYTSDYTLKVGIFYEILL